MSPQTKVCGLFRQFKTYAWICLFVALTFMSCGARAGGGFAFTLPTGTVNQAYSFDLTTMPNVFFNTQFTTQGVNNFGALPPGLSFVNGTSTIFGTPTTAGTYSPAFAVRGIQIAFQYILSFRFLAASPSTDDGSSIVVPPPGSAGTVVLASNLTSGTVFTGGTLMTANGLTSTASFVLGAGGATVVTPPSGTATLSGVISGLGGMTVVSGASTSPSTCLSCSGGILSGAAAVATSSGTVSYQTSAGQTLNLPSLSGGNLVLSGNNTYSGGTTVASGTLQVNGVSSTGSGDVTINSGGMLMGTGTILGNLTVSGILKPGNSPGYLAVGTNVSMASGSLYVQDIAGLVQASSTSPSGATGYYSYLNSTAGQFVINPNVLLAPRLANLFSVGESGYGSSIFVPELGNRFRIVTASGGVTGRFAAVIQPAQLSGGTQFIAFYNVNNSNSIDLATVPTSYANSLDAEKDNAKSVARVLDQLLGVNQVNTATAAQDQLLYAASGQTAASLPAFVKALSGEVHAASAAVLPQAGQRLQQAVLARLSDYPIMPNLLNAALNNGLSSGLISGSNPIGLPTAAVGSNPAVNPNASAHASASLVNGNAWAEIAYQRGDRGGDSQASGYNSNLYQAVFGVDAYTNAALGLKLGGGLALSNTTVNATGGNSTIQQGALFLYGKMPVATDYVLDGMVSLGLSSSKLSRSDITGISNGFSNKSVMGNDVLVSAGLSRPFETSDVRITPYVRLTYQYVGQASYDEGSSAAALNVGRMSANGVRAVIGVGAGSLNKDPLKDEFTYRANIAVGADTTGLLNPTLNTTLGGYSSSVTTATAGSAFVQVGLYGTVKISDNAYAYAGVSGEARTGQTLYGGSVGLRVAF